MKKILKKLIKVFLSDKYIEKYKCAIERYYKKYRCIKLKYKIRCFLFEANKYKFYKQNNMSEILKKTKENAMFSKYFSYFYFLCFFENNT